jgi:hypothetical protein
MRFTEYTELFASYKVLINRIGYIRGIQATTKFAASTTSTATTKGNKVISCSQVVGGQGSLWSIYYGSQPKKKKPLR